MYTHLWIFYSILLKSFFPSLLDHEFYTHLDDPLNTMPSTLLGFIISNDLYIVRKENLYPNLNNFENERWT